jgi:muconolactone delta-isomerase
MVETHFTQQPTQEAMALIPAETEHGIVLDQQGIREHLFVAADFSGVWQVIHAESVAEVQEILASFPLAPFITSTITQL